MFGRKKAKERLAGNNCGSMQDAFVYDFELTNFKLYTEVYEESIVMGRINAIKLNVDRFRSIFVLNHVKSFNHF